MEAPDVAGDGLAGHVAPQIQNESAAAGPQNAPHFAENPDRILKAVQWGTAENEVEGSVGKGHTDRIAVLEVDGDAGFLCPAAGGIDGRTAGAEGGEAETARAGQGDGLGCGAYFKDLAAERQHLRESADKSAKIFTGPGRL